MFRTILKSKIHRATVTQADVDYIGSITIDADLMRAANLVPYEKVQVVDVNNGARLETYAIEGEPGSGVIGMNGAAARLIPAGDKVIVMSYAMLDERELAEHKPTIVLVDEANKPVSIAEAILAGMRFDDLILD